MTRLSAIAIVAVVFLRLLCGWHFYNEGVKKLEPGFSSAGFLRTAKGPLAPLFRSMIPGPYGAHVDLARPVELGSRPAEQRQAIDAWWDDYDKRSAAAAKAGDPLPHDIDPAVPGSTWVGNIASSWDAGLEKLGRVGVDGEVAERLQALRDKHLGTIVYYLHGIEPEIEELQHEEWRLHQLRDHTDGEPAPFQQTLIEQKADEVWQTMQPWIVSVRQIEDEFINEAAAAAADAGVGRARIEGALGEQSLLSWVDLAVTCVVLGSGICVFLGLATRVAGVLAAGFLLSLIMTQPPWVSGSDLTAIFNWAIEMAAFLVLAAVGAGRWAGLDGLIHSVRVRYGDLSPKYQTPHDRAATQATA